MLSLRPSGITTLSDIFIDYVNHFDSIISAQRVRKDERPPPLIDLSRMRRSEQGATAENDGDANEDISKMDRIEVAPNTNITNPFDDNEHHEGYCHRCYH